MKKLFFTLFVIIYTAANAQTWTADQTLAANTAKDIPYLTTVEKEVILYINLARLYPNDFAKIELENYVGSEKYGAYLKDPKSKKSLKKELNSMKALEALSIDKELYENAKCFAKEQGDKGEMGHVRTTCENGKYSECCSYGMETGKDIVMQLLIDHNTPELIHRKICLMGSYSKIGISVHPHQKWGICAILEII
jgi:hypothetical protein